MTCPKRSEARRSNATRCRSYAPWQLSVNVVPEAKRGTQKILRFRYIIFFYPKQMLVYDKEASNKTIGRKPRYFVINQVLPSKA